MLALAFLPRLATILVTLHLNANKRDGWENETAHGSPPASWRADQPRRGPGAAACLCGQPAHPEHRAAEQLHPCPHARSGRRRKAIAGFADDGPCLCLG